MSKYDTVFSGGLSNFKAGRSTVCTSQTNDSGIVLLILHVVVAVQLIPPVPHRIELHSFRYVVVY